MRTGHIVGFLIFPIFLEGCCVGNNLKKRTEPLISCQNTTHQHYRAVKGEVFMMPCLKCVKQHSKVVWTRTGEGNENLSFNCQKMFIAEAKHSGEYTYLTSRLSLYLQVVEINCTRCFHSIESSVVLLVDVHGEVPCPCPGLSCGNDTDVIWYKGNNRVPKPRRRSCVENGSLNLCQVSAVDTSVYFCEWQIIEQEVKWTFRRAVDVKVVPHYKPSDSPTIIYPHDNTTEEVELGKSHTLTCEVHFPKEINVSPEVQWYMHYNGNVRNMTPLYLESQKIEKRTFSVSKVIQRAIIKEVKLQHLNNTYTCIASNTVGHSKVTITLKRKIKVKWPSLVGYPIASLLLVAGVGIVLHVKWLEVQLIYKSRFQNVKHSGAKKEFDVFLSYVWSPPPAEAKDVLTISCQSGLNTQKVCLNSEGDKANQRPLEVLLSQVLEDKWGYRLCLLERDVLPGGAYTNDVVLAIQKSQMLICLLSDDYLSNSNAVFVLESGVQALLQKSILSVLLIWTSKDSGSLNQLDPPLPTTVHRALKVLPSLDWTSGKRDRATENFWRSLRKALPRHRVEQVSLTQKQ